MKPPTTESRCSNSLLLEFLDGELTAGKEQEVAAHIAACPACQIQIDQQRKLLSKLDSSLGDLPEIPADFSKIVSANARSQVSSIRRPYERRTAVLICIGLLALALLAITFGPLNAALGATIIFEKVLSVVALAFSLLSDIVLGIGIVGRAVSTSLGISPVVIFGLVMGSVALLAVRRSQKQTRISGDGQPGR